MAGISSSQDRLAMLSGDEPPSRKEKALAA
jgi:hypothetical protein